MRISAILFVLFFVLPQMAHSQPTAKVVNWSKTIPGSGKAEKVFWAELEVNFAYYGSGADIFCFAHSPFLLKSPITIRGIPGDFWIYPCAYVFQFYPLIFGQTIKIGPNLWRHRTGLMTLPVALPPELIGLRVYFQATMGSLTLGHWATITKPVSWEVVKP